MNKFTKLLSVFIIAGTIGTGIAGVAGCKKGGGGNTDDGHTHSYTWEDNEDGTHTGTCSGCEATAEGHTVTEDHTWNPDGICEKCDAEKPAETDPSKVASVTITTTATSMVAGDELELTATVAPDTAVNKTVTWQIVASETNAAGAEIKDGNKLTATGPGAIRVRAVSADGPFAQKDITVTKMPLYREYIAREDCYIDSADFEDTAEMTKVDATNKGTGGVYVLGETVKGSIADGVGTTNGCGFYIDFGTTKDIIEGTLTVEITKTSGTGWGFIRIMNSTLANNDDYILSSRDNGQYRVNGSGNQGTAGTSVGSAVPSTVEVYFKIDKVNKTGTIKHNDAVVYDGAIDNVDLCGIAVFGKAMSDANELKVSNVAICTSEVGEEAYYEGVGANATALNTAATALKGDAWALTDAGTGTEKKLADAKTAMDAALAATDKTRATVAAAYTTYEGAVLDALKLEFKARLVAAYPATDYTVEGTGSTGNKGDYDAAIAAANEAIDGVSKVADFTDVYSTHSAVLADIHKNEYYSHAEVTITVSDGESSQTITGKRVGDTVTKAELVAKVAVPTGKSVSGFKVNDNVVTLPYTLTDADATGITFTAVFGDREDVDFYYGTKLETVPSAFTETTELLEGIIYGTTGVSLENNSKASGGDGTDLVSATAQVRIKLNGKLAKATDGSDHQKALKLVLPQNAKITVHFMSGNNASRRDLTLFDASGNPTAQTANAGLPTDGTAVDGDAQERLAVYTATAGTWYLGSTVNGVNIYRIVIEWQAGSTTPGGGETDPDTPPTPGEAVAHTYTFSYANIDKTTVSDVTVQDANNNNENTQVKDNGAIAAGALSGEGNSFITVVSGVTYRDGQTNLKKTDGSKNPACIENKDEGLTVTFQGTGTLTITFASSGSSNASRLGVKKSGADTYLEATGELPTGVTRVTETETKDSATIDNIGVYNTTGTAGKTITFTITEAGTYVIDCPSDFTTRGARITGIVMVDNFADAAE